jgi:hypothetical protein
MKVIQNSKMLLGVCMSSSRDCTFSTMLRGEMVSCHPNQSCRKRTVRRIEALQLSDFPLPEIHIARANRQVVSSQLITTSHSEPRLIRLDSPGLIDSIRFDMSGRFRSNRIDISVLLVSIRFRHVSPYLIRFDKPNPVKSSRQSMPRPLKSLRQFPRRPERFRSNPIDNSSPINSFSTCHTTPVHTLSTDHVEPPQFHSTTHLNSSHLL